MRRDAAAGTNMVVNSGELFAGEWIKREAAEVEIRPA